VRARRRVRLVQPRGVRAVYAYGMALLVSRDAGALAGARTRALQTLRAIFFDKRGGAGRRRREFCSDEHRNRLAHASKRGSAGRSPRCREGGCP
jgi:hypothetical protein